MPKDRHGHIEGPPGDSRLESTFTFEDCQRDAGGTATDVVLKLWLCQDEFEESQILFSLFSRQIS